MCILYGVVARGTQSEDSDIDIALLVRGGVFNQVNDLTIDVVVELEYDKVLSVIDIDYEKFHKWENTKPFYKNIKKIG